MRVPRQLRTWRATLLATLVVLLVGTLLLDLGATDVPRPAAAEGAPPGRSEAPAEAVARATPAEAAPPPLTGTTPPAGAPPARGTDRTDAATAMAQRSAPASPGSPATVSPASFSRVTALQPRLRLRAVDPQEVAEQVRRIDGVRFATALRVGKVAVKGRKVSVAAVEPRRFRKVTPQVTADAVGVWQRIVEGDAALTHDTGTRLRTELGATVRAGKRDTPLRVGAYASNGVPPVADALVSIGTADRLGLRGKGHVLVALGQDTDAGEAADRIESVVGLPAEILDEPDTQRAFLVGEDARQRFEPYTYVDMGDGMIQIDSDWVGRNIVSREVPILTGAVTCHRLMVDQLAGALGEIEDNGLANLIDTSDYGGCWVPRHIDFNPARPLSMHSWGLAVDFNVSTNGLGQTPTMDARIVEIFDRWGFAWGGRWSRPDGMHFELGALLDSPQG